MTLSDKILRWPRSDLQVFSRILTLAPTAILFTTAHLLQVTFDGIDDVLRGSARLQSSIQTSALNSSPKILKPNSSLLQPRIKHTLRDTILHVIFTLSKLFMYLQQAGRLSCKDWKSDSQVMWNNFKQRSSFRYRKTFRE